MERATVAGPVIAVIGIVVGIGIAEGWFSPSGSGSSKGTTINNIYGPVSNLYENGSPAANSSNSGTVAAPAKTQSVSCPDETFPPLGSETLIIRLEVKAPTTPCWQTTVTAPPDGGTVRYLFTYENNSKSVQKNVVIGLNLAPKSWVVPNTTTIYNSLFPKGTPDLANNIASGGINIGNYDPGAVGYVTVTVATLLPPGLDCGTTTYTQVATVHPQGLDYFENSAVVKETKPCSSSTS